MFNKVIIVGNLTRDVDLRSLPSGNSAATLGLATNRRYKKQDGSDGEEVCYVDAKLFGRTAEIAKQYLKKGSKVLIEGRLTLETWNDKDGNKHSKHTITAENMQMLDKRQGATSGGYGGDNEGDFEPPRAQNNRANAQNIDIADEDLPF